MSYFEDMSLVSISSIIVPVKSDQFNCYLDLIASPAGLARGSSMQAWELILVPETLEKFYSCRSRPPDSQEEVMRSTMNMEQCNDPHVTHLTQSQCECRVFYCEHCLD